MLSVSWAQPSFSLPVHSYSVSLARLNELGVDPCNSFMDSRPQVTLGGNNTSMMFTNLQEQSRYRLELSTNFRVFGASPNVFIHMFYRTYSDCKYNVLQAQGYYALREILVLH